LLADPSRREDCRRAAAAVSPAFWWSEVLGPLVAFCANPGRAPDLPQWPTSPPQAATQIPPPPAGRMAWGRRDLVTAARLYREGGVRGLLRSVRTRIRQLLRAETSRE
jgi:hypothetical protein